MKKLRVRSVREIEKMMRNETLVVGASGIFIEKAHLTIVVGKMLANHLEWISPYEKLEEHTKDVVYNILRLNRIYNDLASIIKEHKLLYYEHTSTKQY